MLARTTPRKLLKGQLIQLAIASRPYGSVQPPKIVNETMLHYEPMSDERLKLDNALQRMRQGGTSKKIPLVIGGKAIFTDTLLTQQMPSEHAQLACSFSSASEDHVKQAIACALDGKVEWESTPWADRAAIFLKAADLISGKYRADICAATMIGQGKNAWQAEIDAAAELTDFLRFGVHYVTRMYAEQPSHHAKGIWNTTDYRPLEGFVLAISPFNFTAIAANLVCAPAMLGNTVIWKPSAGAVLSNWLIYEVLKEAGLPKNVIQFIPGKADRVVSEALKHPQLSALHFTGSTAVFRKLWKDIAQKIDTYHSYPRIVGETGGKNFHLIHSSAPIKSSVVQSVRAAFEYQGQKCSALSRLYVPRSLWESGFEQQLISETEALSQGNPLQHENFCGPVINDAAFQKITKIIQVAVKDGARVLTGGTSDKKLGYFVKPTIILTDDPHSITMREEIFGPVLTVYVYEDADYESMAEHIDKSSSYALTGSIFARDRQAIMKGREILRHAAGNFYINDKCTGAVVGQQAFGGARQSGTNDKSGSLAFFSRFTSTRSIKENFIEPGVVQYPSNI